MILIDRSDNVKTRAQNTPPLHPFRSEIRPPINNINPLLDSIEQPNYTGESSMCSGLHIAVREKDLPTCLRVVCSIPGWLQI